MIDGEVTGLRVGVVERMWDMIAVAMYPNGSRLTIRGAGFSSPARPPSANRPPLVILTGPRHDPPTAYGHAHEAVWSAA